MNIIDTIRVSGTDYTLSATTSGGITSGEVQTMIDESVSGITERMAEDEEVTAAALNNLNDRISGISGNNVVELTQVEYDGLVSGGTVDPTAFYIITDATPVDISNYWTSAQTNSAINAAVSGKVDTSTFNTYSGNVETALSGKQDTLSAGTGIDITNNVISATGGGGGGKAVSGGRGITVTSGETADTVSFNLPIYSGTGEGSIIGGFSGNTASGEYSIALGGRYESQFSYNYCKATNKGSVSFGGQATGEGAFTCGESTKASGRYSAAIGCYVGEASGIESFITGRNNKAKGFTTFVSGYENTGENDYEFVVGHLAKSNKANTTFGDSGNTLFSVGNGASTSARHNAFEIRQNGDIYITKDGQDVKLQDQLGGSSITVDSALSSTSENPVQNKVIYSKIDEVEQVTAAALNALNDRIAALEAIIQNMNNQ